MATTNLISKSLGDILTESGNGSPDHVSPKGSLYTDKDTAKIYQNKDGSNNWYELNTIAYGEVYFVENTNATTINTQNVWESANVTYTGGTSVGFSADTSSLTLLNGYDGFYEIRGDATISYVAGTNNYEVGLSINGGDPLSGTYGGSLIDATYTRQHIGFDTVQYLTGGTTLSFDIRNITNTDNVILRHGQIVTRRKS
jgi:hypothetical protein